MFPENNDPAIDFATSFPAQVVAAVSGRTLGLLITNKKDFTKMISQWPFKQDVLKMVNELEEGEIPMQISRSPSYHP